MNRRKLTEYKLATVQWNLMRRIEAGERLRDQTKQNDDQVRSLRGEEAALLKALKKHIPDASETPLSPEERRENADLLVIDALERLPLRAALRQFFEDSAPESIDRESVLAMVRHVLPDAKEGTVFSTLSKLVAEGVVEKDNTGYWGKPRK